MKASEIFLHYAAPLQDLAPATGNADEVQALLRLPELVWNAIVLDENKKRKPGQLPKLLKSHLASVPAQERKMIQAALKIWVRRKDELFGNHNWLADVEVYKNVKQEVIVRVLVRQPKHLAVTDMPEEWRNPKTPAQVLPFITPPSR